MSKRTWVSLQACIVKILTQDLQDTLTTKRYANRTKEEPTIIQFGRSNRFSVQLGVLDNLFWRDHIVQM